MVNIRDENKLRHSLPNLKRELKGIPAYDKSPPKSNPKEVVFKATVEQIPQEFYRSHDPRL